jgi:hypothetical protein
MIYSIASDRPADLPIGQRWPTFAVFTCDRDHGFLPAPSVRVEGEHDDREAEIRARGWKLYAGPDSDQTLCPECAR